LAWKTQCAVRSPERASRCCSIKYCVFVSTRVIDSWAYCSTRPRNVVRPSSLAIPRHAEEVTCQRQTYILSAFAPALTLSSCFRLFLIHQLTFTICSILYRGLVVQKRCEWRMLSVAGPRKPSIEFATQESQFWPCRPHSRFQRYLHAVRRVKE
jgi:hypothetical protein